MKLPPPPKLTEEDLKKLDEEGQKCLEEITKKMNAMSVPSIRCPKCGHHFIDKRVVK